MVLAVNAHGPLVDLGVGVGVNDEVEYREQQGTGIHVVSSPHRLKLSDLENHPIASVSISLKYCLLRALLNPSCLYSCLLPLFSLDPTPLVLWMPMNLFTTWTDVRLRG